MKRYWLFAGDEYYPRGGGLDFVSTHDTINEAVEHGRDCNREWWHVFDAELQSVIFEGDSQRVGFGSPPKTEQRERF